MNKCERLSKGMADYHLGIAKELLAEREELNGQEDTLKAELRRIRAIQDEITECVNVTFKFLHVMNVRLPAEGYAILGLFEDGTEPPL